MKIANILGQKVSWHNHAGENELFYIIKGSLLIEIENKEAFTMNKGDFYVVKKE
ncbi:cupin domain-containing protein [Gramella sp. MAR_2010_147]|uniref:cupin domain-containing protein n=1 Tax=Gramella sp. MAR_2010_147 TaxID=1250205 RepID=UPI000B7FF141|nr:cupin domain-containing protein [Gramella sp. MAR_2010_147]